MVLPSGHVLSLNVGDTLLNALRTHDVPVSYSCEDGRCGLCRCKVIHGRVIESSRQMRPFAGPKTSYVLACQSVLTDDCTIEVAEPKEVVVHAPRSTKAMILAVETPSRDVRLVRLKPDSALTFSPGQHIEVEFERGLRRYYSLGGIDGDGDLRIHVKVHFGGRASSHVASTLKVGDCVRIRGPLGAAYLRCYNDEPIVCAAAGTGLGAMISIVRGMVAQGMKNPLHVYAGFASRSDVYGIEELAQALAQLPKARAVQLVVATGALDRGMRRGLLTSTIAADHPDMHEYRAYVYGSPYAAEATVRQLRRLGVVDERLYAEPFYPTGN